MTHVFDSPPVTALPAGHGVDRSNSTPRRPGLPLARRGRLKNGNPSGDFLAARRCGAHTRCGGSCRQPAMPNGRCRLHGGLSTGPRTPAGLARSRRARWKHGARSAEVTALRRAARTQLRRVRTVLIRMCAPSAGHGVDRSNSEFPVGARCARPPLSSGIVSIGPRPDGPRAGAARPCTERSISAGHGLHRSVSQSVLPSRRDHLRSSAAICGLTYRPPAGHGVHRSNHERAPLHHRPT